MRMLGKPPPSPFKSLFWQVPCILFIHCLIQGPFRLQYRLTESYLTDPVFPIIALTTFFFLAPGVFPWSIKSRYLGGAIRGPSFTKPGLEIGHPNWKQRTEDPSDGSIYVHCSWMKDTGTRVLLLSPWTYDNDRMRECINLNTLGWCHRNLQSDHLSGAYHSSNMNMFQ